jgi:quercetin dioxygenase-like cupin family protein
LTDAVPWDLPLRVNQGRCREGIPGVLETGDPREADGYREDKQVTERDSGWGKDGWAVPLGQGELLDLGGPHRPEVLVRGTGVAAAFGAFVFHHDVITENPPHAHHDWAKVLYVLEGDYEFRVGDAEFAGGPGTTVVVPRGSYHTFVTATGGKILFVSGPAGNEAMFLELARLGPAVSPEQAAEVEERFGTTTLTGKDAVPWRGLWR